MEFDFNHYEYKIVAGYSPVITNSFFIYLLNEKAYIGKNIQTKFRIIIVNILVIKNEVLPPADLIIKWFILI